MITIQQVMNSTQDMFGVVVSDALPVISNSQLGSSCCNQLN